MPLSRAALLTASALLLAACSSRPTTPRVDPATPTGQQIAHLKQVITTQNGNPVVGESLFAARCGRCHTLNGKGGKLAPDLTHYTRDRESLDFLLTSIVNPQREVHDYHTAYEVTLADGRHLTAVILEQGSDALVLIDSTGQQVSVSPKQITSRKPVMNSLMPDALLNGLTDQQVADLFAYIMKH
jgi:putative heme-binding domain-containing protein